MEDPLEASIESILDAADIKFSRPEKDPTTPVNLDFYLPEFDTYIEVKQFHSDWISGQLAKVEPGKSVIVLQGPESVMKFLTLAVIIGRA